MRLHREISLLVPSMQTRAQDAIDEMNSDAKLKSLGVERVFVVETKRDLVVQMAYYSSGRMEPKYVRAMYEAAGLYAIGDAEAKNIKTNTLKSKHIDGRAIDIAPWKNGDIWWNAPDEVWARMGEIGKSHNLTWGIVVGKSIDSPHYELP